MVAKPPEELVLFYLRYPPADALALKQMGVASVYTPKDFKITGIMSDVVKLVAKNQATN